MLKNTSPQSALQNLTHLYHMLKVEALVPDHLSNFRIGGVEQELVEIFPCRETRSMEIVKFSDFNSQN